MATLEKETDLYAPVKDLLEREGYLVRAEVGDCDVMGKKDGECVVVELKLRLNLEVVCQAALRQKIADCVYIAAPGPKKASLKKWQNTCHVLRRLSIGLITVKDGKAKVTFPAKPLDVGASRARARGKKQSLEEEFSGRHGDENVGGTNGKIVTVYREKALLIAGVIERCGTVALSDLSALTGNPKAREIIRHNYYGWFETSEETVTLSEAGRRGVGEYRALTDRLIKDI